MPSARVLLFGDQSAEKVGAIRNLTHLAKRSPTLRRFLRESADILQIEAEKLGPVARKAFSGFDDLLTMAEANARQDVPDELVATPLMCIARLGELLLYAEKDPDILMKTRSKVHIIGLCTGLIPACVAMVATDVAGLFKYGLEMVAISLRLAYEVNMRSKRVEDIQESWAYSVVGATAADTQAILDSFHERNAIPLYRQAYVAVISRTWTTISGPPSTLSQLWKDSPELGLAPKLRLAVAGAVHAHTLPPLIPGKIIGQSELLATAIRSEIPIVSSSTCECYSADDLRSLLHLMLADIGQNTLRLTDTIQEVVKELRGQDSIDLFVVGPTAHTSMVQDALKSAGMAVNVVRQAEAPTAVHSTREGSDLVAIVGMSGRFPGGGENLQQIWDLLLQGRDVHEKIPASRFDLDAHFDEHGTLKNSTTVSYGCFLEKPGLFDPRLFNISPREALQMDPMQRLLLMTTYEALEMSGYNLNGSYSTNSKRIATYIGQTTDDWRQNNECQGIDVYFIPGNCRAFYPGRLNYHYKWEGASYSLDSACASSSTAVASACSALLSRECDTAIAGGGNLLTSPAIFAGLSRGGFLSKTGGCKTFRDDADGYCRGEGVSVVILKRLEDALAENDNIQAVINGSARTHSAGAISITQPCVESQRNLYEKIFQKSGVNPRDIGYVEMHGTGTQAGDTTEVQSVADIFCAGRTKDNPLFVGAVKANIGHGEAAAGVSSLVKSVLMLRERRIPPHPGMPCKLNHKFPPLEKLHMKISEKARPFDSHSKDGKRRIFLNNFDASGGNTGLIIEEFVHQRQKKKDPRPYHVVTCSGHASYSLKKNKERLLQYLEKSPAIKIADVAYTTTARRMHHAFRTSFSVRTTKELIESLKSDCASAQSLGVSGHDGHSSVVWVFTGQGSLYSGMGKQLFQTCTRFRESILSFQRICDSQGLPSVINFISSSEGSQSRQATMVQMQLAIIFLELALAELWRSWGICPDLVLGHSLGEYSALCVSGVLSVTDTIYLVSKRSSILQERCSPGTHAMLVVKSSAEHLKHQINAERLSSCEVSCRNSPSQTVASGTVQDLEYLKNHLESTGVSTRLLQVPHGFHSAQVEPILGDFEASARGIHFALPKIPIVSTLTATVVDNVGHFTSKYLARQAREPVDFLGALQTCKDSNLVDDHTTWIEFGPDPLCLGMIRSSLGVPSQNLLASISPAEDNWKTTSAALASAYMARLSIDWEAYHQEYLESLTLLELPTYAFDLKEFWSTYKHNMMGPGEDKTRASTKDATQTTAAPLTTCLQYVIDESLQGTNPSATFVSYTSEPNLYQIIQGHIINGVALCPASVFCDMANAAAEYLYTKANSGKAPPSAMSLHDLEITHPIVVHAPDRQQKIEVKAIKADNDWSVNVSFSSGASSTHQHGVCQIRFDMRGSWRKEFSRSIHLVQKRMDAVVQASMSGNGHRFLKPVVYKLFSDLVGYGENYQGLEEVFLHTGCREAVGRIKLKPNRNSGKFAQNPYRTDNIVHLAGFILNGDVTKANDMAFIATGFESMYLIEELNVDEEYTSYVCIQDAEKRDNLTGDVYVFKGNTIVAICAGLCFHRMLKRTLAAIMGIAVSPTSAKVSGRESQKPMTNTLLALDPTKTNDSATLTTRNAPLESSSRAVAVKEKAKDTADLLLGIVASESGYSPEDMQPSTKFSDMGVDSLMSITIISVARSQLEMELPASFFIDNSTIKDVRLALNTSRDTDDAPIAADIPDPDTPNSTPDPDDISSPADDGLKDASDATSFDEPLTPELKPSVISHVTSDDESSGSQLNPSVATNAKPPARVVLLQGRASSTETPVYLATDGAGSAAAYIHIPPLPGGRRLYALESPYLQNPTDWHCSIEEYCSLFVDALQGSQPHGPYIIGGWSAGAVYAFEITRQLSQRGEEVKCLFMIDMRVPKPMPDALEPTQELIEQAGLVTGIVRSGQILSEISENLKEHLVSTVKALKMYEPQPMDPALRPGRSFMVWARQGIDEEKLAQMKVDWEQGEPTGNVMEDEKTGLKGWFFAKRQVFGPNGWDQMVGDIECHVMEADHFNMVTPPRVKELGKILSMAVGKAEAAWKTTHPAENT